MRSVVLVCLVVAAAGSQCGWGCGTDSDCNDNPTCPYCIYGKCVAQQQCPVIPCNDSRACPYTLGEGWCSRCIVGGTPAPPPSPTPPPPPPAPCSACGPGDVCCDPNASPPEMCPGNIACCQCGSPACKCPSSVAPKLFLGNTSKGVCGLGLPCGSPCQLDGDCDQTGSCRSCGGVGVCTHSS
eukprot:TRINITY_DN30598_c0_g1_i1.p1 TRINITY_DN30598_c0_g1~~TRINITY_DN30598_c0_g1_i1.p1  ORF type:complete len:183 (+),score=33.82 TRINITY_DN30598_c0_g1_i1:40-588(+)